MANKVCTLCYHFRDQHGIGLPSGPCKVGGCNCESFQDFDEKIAHPSYYGGADNPYEAIKVIRAWKLNFSLGNAIKYICRAGKRAGKIELTHLNSTAREFQEIPSNLDGRLEDLKKARWYLDEEIESLERPKTGCQCLCLRAGKSDLPDAQLLVADARCTYCGGTGIVK